MLTVLRRRDFALLWFAGVVSLTGDWMLGVALPVAVYALTGSALATGGVLVANRLSALALGSVAGLFVDRWDRRWARGSWGRPFGSTSTRRYGAARGRPAG